MDGDEVRAFSYAYDAVGRPVGRDSDSFAYNARGEVTSAVLDGSSNRYEMVENMSSKKYDANMGTTRQASATHASRE